MKTLYTFKEFLLLNIMGTLLLRNKDMISKFLKGTNITHKLIHNVFKENHSSNLEKWCSLMFCSGIILNYNISNGN